MINFLLSYILLFVSANADIDAFQGSIEMIQKSQYETSYFTYFVKNDNVRIDKFDNNHTLKQSLYINLSSEQIYVLCPIKRLYSKIEVNKNKLAENDNFIIQKTENSRIVNDYLCYQWRVKNKERNTEVAYWVSQDNFYFFERLISLINSTDKTYEFFEKIPETQGFFPMLSVERTLLRKEKSRLYVVHISNKTVNDDIFTIPSDCKLVLR